MCGRVIVDYDEIIPVSSDTALSDWVTGKPAGAESSFNVKPTQQIPVAYTDHTTGEFRFETAFWSLLPIWAKELKPKYPTFNARIETVAEKQSFAPSVKSSRCAIVTSGFYEWTGLKTARKPHAIFGPEKLLSMAGLFSWWHEPGAAEDEGWHLTTTILTQDSDGVMKDLHDRMPVFLEDELTSDWLDPRISGVDLLTPAAEASRAISHDLREHEVKPLRGDGPELLDPFTASQTPTDTLF